jgi:multimeric flavodoxin WrbA
MKLLIHDLDEKAFQSIFPEPLKDVMVISDDGTIKPCIGCFSCWMKNPGECILRDNYTMLGEYLSKTDEYILISKCTYGGFSPFVKNAVDRGLSYGHPYFEIRNGEMHHRRRYDNMLNMKVWFYGEDVTEAEKKTAEGLVKANCINLDCNLKQLTFVQDPSGIRDGVL